MSLMRVGLVDLDTSHPAAWVPILLKMGHRVVGVFDGGAVHDPAYARQFAERFGIERVYESLEEMAQRVDVAIIHSCNWDLHVDRAEPFLRAGKAVLIDKPIAGNAHDARRLLEWERQGARIAGGSSLRFAREVEEFLARPPDQRGTISYAMAGCGVDGFNYGIHAYALLSGLLGPGIERARYLGTSGQDLVELVWRGGARGIAAVGPTKGHMPFYLTAVTDRGVHHWQIDSQRLYEQFLAGVMPQLAGEAPLLPLAELLEPELAAMAVLASRRREGEPVSLSDSVCGDVAYDGKAFGAAYRAQRRAAG